MNKTSLKFKINRDAASTPYFAVQKYILIKGEKYEEKT